MELKENKFVAGGLHRLLRGQKKLSFESLKKRRAAELSKATTEQRQKIYEEIFTELERQKNHAPSANTLW